ELHGEEMIRNELVRIVPLVDSHIERRSRHVAALRSNANASAFGQVHVIVPRMITRPGRTGAEGSAGLPTSRRAAIRRRPRPTAIDGRGRGVPWPRTCERLLGGGYGDDTQRHNARTRECGCEIRPLG